MKFASPLIRGIGVVALIAIALIAAYMPRDAREAAPKSYHISRWNDVAPEVDRALRENGAQKPSELGRIYGIMLPHHIPATIPRLVIYYSRLKETQDVKEFILIGPDHNDSGKAPITVSAASFMTVFGKLDPIPGLARALSESGVAFIEESPFEEEHSIGAHMLLISRIFPEAKVTPIILRSSASKEEVEALGKAIARYLDEDTVLLASVDFSHYLGTDQAVPLDMRSAAVLQNLDIGSISLVNADSGKSAAAFMAAMLEKGATRTDAFEVLNTNDFMQNTDYTTGYVFGFWGLTSIERGRQ